MKIYLAAPLFDDEERQLNSLIAKRLRALGHAVYCPQEFAEASDESITRKEIFNRDISQLQWCDCAVAVLNGIVTDPGVCFEIGYLNAQNKPVYALSSDSRSFIHGHLNAMLEQGVKCVFRGLNELTDGIGEDSS
jgi:nucleoside 2-deoxyribosyltransferase